MKKLRLLIVIFCLALSIPLGYLVVRTYWSLDQEEVAELRYFATTLFDTMEEDLASLVLKEEGRALGEYLYHYIPANQMNGGKSGSRSPLSRLPEQHYILGYLQNNPDGSFETPLLENKVNIPSELNPVVAKLDEANQRFNRRRSTVPESIESQASELLAQRQKEETSSFAEKYLDLSRSKKQKAHLGQETKRVEQLSTDQTVALAQPDQKTMMRQQRQPPPRTLQEWTVIRLYGR